jgi:hypothetical protein
MIVEYKPNNVENPDKICIALQSVLYMRGLSVAIAIAGAKPHKAP